MYPEKFIGDDRNSLKNHETLVNLTSLQKVTVWDRS